MIFRLLRRYLILSFLALLLAGKVEAAETLFKVVTSFYPLYIAVLNVAREVPGVTVVNMTRPFTGCLHDYQATPADMAALAEADVFVVNGAGMENFLGKVLKQYPQLPLITASDGVELLRDEHGENPHVWVSVSLHQKQVSKIAVELARLNPVHAQAYLSNAAAYAARLENLKQRMHQALAGAANRSIVTFHEAFAYFAQEFSLNVVAVVEREPGTEPNARELAEAIEQIRTSNVQAIFVEPQYPSRSAQTIARETKTPVYVLDPAVTGPLRADAYLEIMEKNAKELARALGN